MIGFGGHRQNQVSLISSSFLPEEYAFSSFTAARLICSIQCVTHTSGSVRLSVKATVFKLGWMWWNRQDTIHLLRTRPVAAVINRALNVTSYYSECWINTMSPVQPQLLSIGHRVPSDGMTDLRGSFSYGISLSGQGKRGGGSARDEQRREQSFADPWGRVCQLGGAQHVLGCVTGPGRAWRVAGTYGADFTLALHASSVVVRWDRGGAPHFSLSSWVENKLKALMFVSVCLSSWDGLTAETMA